MNNYALTGASLPLKISGREFAAYTFSDRDYVELDGYIQAKVIEIARSSLSSLTDTERSEMLQAAIKAAAQTGWGTVEGARIMNSVEGAFRLGWQMIRKDSNISFEDFFKLAQSKEHRVDNLLCIDECFIALNMDSEKDESKEDVPKEGTSEEPKR
jgi:divalent metal cation (Fe/Co/Zn/Cd) transporter